MLLFPNSTSKNQLSIWRFGVGREYWSWQYSHIWCSHWLLRNIYRMSIFPNSTLKSKHPIWRLAWPENTGLGNMALMLSLFTDEISGIYGITNLPNIFLLARKKHLKIIVIILFFQYFVVNLMLVVLCITTLNMSWLQALRWVQYEDDC